jgi:hypothetical protein
LSSGVSQATRFSVALMSYLRESVFFGEFA